MSITKTLLAGAAGTVLASGMAAAGEPMKLSTTEMDQVTAGRYSSEAFTYPSLLAGFRGTINDKVAVSGSDTFDERTGGREVSARGSGESSSTGRGFFIPGTRFGLDAFVFGGLYGEGVADASR